MEERRGIASSPATGMAEDDQQPDPEPRLDPSVEWFISIFGVDDQQPDPEARSKHRIPKAPAKFREYEQDKEYFDPRVVSLGPYHHGEDHLEPMEKHKITAAKKFVDEFRCETEGTGAIYRKFIELTEDLKGYYDAEVVADMSDDDFAGMMFLDGCFVLYFILEIMEVSNELNIRLIIRDMFLMENQLPFEVLDALMKLGWGSSKLVKRNIVEFIKLKVLMPMGFYPLNYSRSLEWRKALDIIEYGSPLHLLDILRTILLNFSPSMGAEMHSKPRNFGSVMELKETGIRFENRRMKSLMDISFKEHLLFPRLLLPTMFITDTAISQLLNLTAFEAFSYSGWGVTSYIHFMDSLINDDADVKMLRSKGILHHSLGSDDEVTRLFNKWPANVRKDLQQYRDISEQILRHRHRKVKISIATWLEKYFGTAWRAMSLVGAGLLLLVTCIQTYFAVFPRR